MRAFLLGVILAIPFYLMKRQMNKTGASGIDSVKVKMNAPTRVDRPQTAIENFERVERVSREVVSQKGEDYSHHNRSIPSEVEEEEGTEELATQEEGVNAPLESVEHVQMTDLEASWSQELREFLQQLGPTEADSLHKAYFQEQEQYQALLESLMSERQLKTNNESAEETNQLINDLEQKHQEKMRDILGPHYDMVTEHYENFLENFRPQETL